MPLESGTCIGPYEVRAAIGAGPAYTPFFM
jgi:hypothetical protein